MRKEVRQHLAELGLLAQDEVDETPRSDMLTPTDHDQDSSRAIAF